VLIASCHHMGFLRLTDRAANQQSCNIFKDAWCQGSKFRKRASRGRGQTPSNIANRFLGWYNMYKQNYVSSNCR
jgi:hypothetical protein